ncbi:MAG TPA: hypothetical protein VHM90_09865, partial [Phycisphaerae bacterium]|nr:hypothetical protein [Phycisphaerae bacterium]
IANAIKGHDGLVFTNLINHNAVMFCLPLDTKTSFKPQSQFEQFKLDAPVAFLIDTRFQPSSFLPKDFAQKWHVIKEIPNIPEPFKFYIVAPIPAQTNPAIIPPATAPLNGT